MDDLEQRVLQIFRDALDTDDAMREDFLSQRCGEHGELRDRVGALLARLADAEDTDVDGAGRIAGDVDPLIGLSIGPFRVVERIGRGGMGVVYRGTRDDAGFAQDVAIKLIRRGYDFDDVHARFLRERRILARLSHPNLAHFIDGGLDVRGRPWFALQFVDGVTITRWCDEHRLGVRARARLFMDVAAAVQYAHTQLVVHRDLKPGNVLVDPRGVVRLLDFGVAGLLDAGHDDSEAQSTIGARRAMTPEYAAPEQFSAGIVGVAADVYALGVILHELIAGALPYAVDRSDPDAIEKRVREMPPRALVTTLRDDEVARLAARRTSLRAFKADVHGDISRIVEKALAKEPDRRYPTVQAFADDVDRWLRGAPVHAVGNGAAYRLRKFIGRNRVVVAFAALAAIAASVGVAAMGWQMHATRMQRDAAEAEAERGRGVRDYVMLLFRNAGEQGDAGSVTVHDVFKRGTEHLFEQYKDQPDTGQNIALMLSELYIHLGDNDGAKFLLERLLSWPGVDDKPDLVASARFNLAQAELAHGDAARARELLDQAQAHWNGDPARHALDLNISRETQADIEIADGHVDAAIATLESSIAERRRLLSAPDRELATSINGLAVALLNAGRFDEALTRASEGLALYEALGLGRSSAGLAAINNRAAAEYRLGRFDAAVADFRQAVGLRRELFGPTTELADAMNNLGVALIHQQKHAEAIPLLEEALQIAITKDGERGRAAFAPRRNLADAYVAVGRVAEAAPLAESGVAIGREQFGATSVFAGSAYATLARTRLAQGRKTEARSALDAATSIFTGLGDAGAVYLPTLAPLRATLDGS